MDKKQRLSAVELVVEAFRDTFQEQADTIEEHSNQIQILSVDLNRSRESEAEAWKTVKEIRDKYDALVDTV